MLFNHLKCTLLLVLTFLFLFNQGFTQTSEIEGVIKIDELETDNTNDNLLVRQSDGTLARRDATTLGGSILTVSLTGDTLYQGEHGFIIIPGLSLANPVTVKYRVTYNATWSAINHPTDFPGNPHFSPLIGMTHNSSVQMFAPGIFASTGIKNVAEFGSTGVLTNEITAYQMNGTAQSRISGGAIGLSPDSVSTEFDLTNSHPLVSLVTMVAPSPDWFVGVRDISLIENGRWVDNKTVDISIYDSGTDSGVSYTSGNQITNPAVPVFMITDPPLGDGIMVPSMGTVTFELLDN